MPSIELGDVRVTAIDAEAEQLCHLPEVFEPELEKCLTPEELMDYQPSWPPSILFVKEA